MSQLNDLLVKYLKGLSEGVAGQVNTSLITSFAEGREYRINYRDTILQRGDAYCARTVSQKRTDKVKARRKAWGCSGKKSVKK